MPFFVNKKKYKKKFVRQARLPQSAYPPLDLAEVVEPYRKKAEQQKDDEFVSRR